MELLDLRSRLADILSSDLGKYPGGIPAIWVTPPEPPGVPEGLQCIVQRVCEGSIELLNAGQRLHERDYIVTLTNFNRSNTLLGALNKVSQNFQVKRYSYMPITEQTYEQAKIFILDPIVVNGV
ncbi:MAG: hypothetical protein F6K31_12905 [Symploca sp. SIO2G7]|nr:hypothetical protein [Symploca sp. SIO2G7]